VSQNAIEVEVGAEIDARYKIHSLLILKCNACQKSNLTAPLEGFDLARANAIN
jgi:hypothetical protein